MAVVFSLCLFFMIGALRAQIDIGDRCRLQSTGDQGICTLLNNCQEAITALQVYHRFPQTCGFKDTQPIVCCSMTSMTTTTTTTTTTTRRTITKPSTADPRRPPAPGDISKQKCREYGEYVYVLRPNPSLSDDASFIKRYECGFKVETLIIGGTKATVKEFPHQAVIGYEGTPGEVTWECGGSLISENYILTAGHCLFSRQSGDAKYVKMGILKLTDTRAMQVRNVVERIRYPEYIPPSHYNDIGLLKVDPKFDMNSYVRPACLFTDFNIPTQRAIATGWGRQDFTDELGSNDLLKVTLEFYTVQECNNSYKNQAGDRKLRDGIQTNTQICAGSHTENKDTCQGDSGGPLQIYHQGADIRCMYDIVGVTSFGKACGIGNHPGVYTRISTYIKWIESTVWS